MGDEEKMATEAKSQDPIAEIAFPLAGRPEYRGGELSAASARTIEMFVGAAGTFLNSLAGILSEQYDFDWGEVQGWTIATEAVVIQTTGDHCTIRRR